MNTPTKLNLGCGGRPLSGYVNIDSDNREQLLARYPGLSIPDEVVVQQGDVLDLPFPDGSVDEVQADSIVEHMSFMEEPRFFNEVRRVLKPGGLFDFSTTDFEAIVRLWLDAKDDWKDFYRNDDDAIRSTHWFGTHSYGVDNRWGYLVAMMFGSQNGDGQYHRNCYTEGKIRAIMGRLGFERTEISRYRWKEDRDPMLRCRAYAP